MVLYTCSLNLSGTYKGFTSLYKKFVLLSEKGSEKHLLLVKENCLYFEIIQLL